MEPVANETTFFDRDRWLITDRLGDRRSDVRHRVQLAAQPTKRLGLALLQHRKHIRQLLQTLAQREQVASVGATGRGLRDEAFEDAGANCDERMEMKRLEPMYRLQFADKRMEPRM